LRLADDASSGRIASAVLTLDLKGMNRIEDIDVRFNGVSLAWNGYRYNHFDHGCWNDTLQYVVPPALPQCGANTIELRRLAENAGFAGAVEVRKCILDVKYSNSFAPGGSPTPWPGQSEPTMP
jgi:hypothetical protein